MKYEAEEWYWIVDPNTDTVCPALYDRGGYGGDTFFSPEGGHDGVSYPAADVTVVAHIPRPRLPADAWGGL